MTNNSTQPDPTAADPRPAFASAVATAAETIGEVGPEQMTSPTPCSDMDVRAILEHMVMVLQRVACAGRGEPAAEWPVAGPDLGDEEWSAAWVDAARDAEAAWNDDGLLGKSVELPWATMTGAECLAIYTNEVVIHTWDLARATGQSPKWSDSAIDVSLAAIHSQLPDADRAPMWAEARASIPPEYDSEWSDPFGPAVDVPDSAPKIDKLVAWNGRQP